MPERPFGAEGGRLPLVGLGCSRIGSFNNPTPMSEIRKTLDKALELGVRLLDTADVYGQGDSEREVGRLLAGRRDRAFVVTKVGKRFSGPMRFLRPLKPILKPLLTGAKGGREAIVNRRESNMASDFSPDYIARALDASLRRMRFDHVDALLLHSPEAGEAGAEAAEALLSLKRAGKARHVGMSCDDIQALDAIIDLPGLDLLELPLDVIEASIASGRMKTIEDRAIGVLAREVIRFQPGVPAPDAVARAARMKGITSVVVGTSNPDHLREILDRLELLSPPAAEYQGTSRSTTSGR